MLIFLFIQNNAIDHIGGESKKRVSSEIGLHFFIRRGTDKFCTDTFQSFIYQPYFFIFKTKWKTYLKQLEPKK